ncbi:MAG: hypothetical protein L0323_18150 [Planctomycetes bacterium]|nr:hypothetical protein [Planctomycetota bacterium]
MKANPYFLSALLSGFVAALVSGALRRGAPAEPGLREELARIGSELTELRTRADRAAGELESLRSASGASAAPAPRVSHEEIEATVARWLEKNAPQAVAAPGNGTPTGAAGRAAEASTAKGAPLTIEEASRMLLDPEIDEDKMQEIWNKLRAQGLLDEMVAWFEERAKQDPNNADKQVELGQAYVQKIFEAGNTPEAGTWAIKADKSWDRALEIEPRNWDARFSKAVGLSFWPPIFGKQPEAIRQFEILLEQQESGPLQPDYAQTYLLLGNLHLQAGANERATAVWQKGLALFPSNAALRARLAPR